MVRWDGTGEPSAAELKDRLVDLASRTSSALFEGRVLGMLDGVKELFGSEQALATAPCADGLCCCAKE